MGRKPTCGRIVSTFFVTLLLAGLFAPLVKALEVKGASCPQSLEASLSGPVDRSGPLGTWYMNANSYYVTVTISPGSVPETYEGTLINESGGSEPLDNISWDASTRRLEFRRNGRGF